MNSGQFKETHGKRHSRIYTCWTNMKQRCLNKNHKSYKDYGARGIKICDEWVNSFESFYRDMGDQEEYMTIERIDVNGDYTPDNCRWASRYEQSINKERTKRYKYKGCYYSLSELTALAAVSRSCLWFRLSNNWDVTLAVETPARAGRNRHTTPNKTKLGNQVDVPEVLCQNN